MNPPDFQAAVRAENDANIRNATVDDIPQMCELLALLFTQEADFTPDPARQARALRLILEQPETGFIRCAVDRERVIGMVSILFTISTAEGGRAAWLEDMVVLPGHRGHGLGDRLLRDAIQAATAAGCTRITLLTDRTNTSAIRFYQRAGFLRSEMTPMRLNCQGGQATACHEHPA